MPRNMSFSMTTEQIRKGTKTVTRRFGWWFLQPGDVVWAVEKAMGLQKGEKIKKIRLLKIVSTMAEPLDTITREDCIREGFPDLSPGEFVEKLCAHYHCRSDDEVNRIEFCYL